MQNGQVRSRAPAAERAMQRILRCLTSVQNGNFGVRLPSDWTDLEGKVADSLNEIIAANERMAKELKRVSTMVGKKGKIGQRAAFSSAGGD
jgi:uncharacterized protein YqgV (UPF0045/DUF77 family)